MKYAIVILGGVATSEPCRSLSGRTSLQSVSAPALADIARTGRVGAVATTPRDVAPSAEACAGALLGHDPARCALSPAALQAIALDIDAAPHDAFLSLSLLSTLDEAGASAPGAVAGPTPGLTRAEAALLTADLLTAWRAAEPELARSLAVAQRADAPGHILIDRSGRSYDGVRTTPPEALASSRAPWRKLAPSGAGDLGPALARLVDAGVAVLAEHDVNRARRDNGMRPATLAWIWGSGRRPTLPDITDDTGLRAAIVTRADAVAGLARAAGWDRVPLPLSPLDAASEDLDSLGAAATGALDRYDLVCAHVEAHAADPAGAAAALERIDAAIIAPLLARLRALPPDAPGDHAGWRMLVACDRAVAFENRDNAHASPARPVPFAMAGAWVRSVIDRPFTEQAASESDLHVDPGSDLMEYFLFGGMKHLRPQKPARPRRRPATPQEADGDRPR